LLGQTLANLLGARCLALTRHEADLARPSLVVESLNDAAGDLPIDLLINCAAYTRVDQAESEEGLAMVVNGLAPGVLANWCQARHIPIVHFSSDYVFSGSGTAPWREDDPPAPINSYGRTKAEGDRRIAAAAEEWLIFRPTWVYGGTGKSFFTSMLARAREQEILRIVDDQCGAPTYARHLGEAVLQGIERAQGMPVFPSGVYHLCHSGETTWYRFFLEILAAARVRGLPLAVQQVEPVTTASFGAAAQRPANSRLDTDKARRVLGLSLPGWQEGLRDCVEDWL
jgi:dTDP-4-dehydrorhamnose reductase